MKPLLMSASAGLVCTMLFAGTAFAFNKTYHEPKVGGDRLDFCLKWGEGCGKPAADAFCAKKGFVSSKSHVPAYNIGAATPTRLITTGAVCDQGFCDGFQSVTCSKPDVIQPQAKTYIAPKFNGMRLDLCVDWGTGCGQPAALQYCKAKGWSKLKSYAVANDIGGATPTRLIGTGAVCDQGFCDGFKLISCSN